MLRDTIAAPATPRGVSALAVIRISGPQTAALGRALLRPFKQTPNLMFRAQAVDAAGALLDDVMACYFAGPKSYSGEDSLELFVHGNPLIVQNVMRAITEFPQVRWAEPGEFTQRSFYNGKLDLIQAEAVGDLLHATAAQGIQNAQKMLGGALSHDIAQITQQVKQMSALLELDVDFAEEELEVDQSSWMPQLEQIQQSLEQIQNKFREKYSGHQVPQIVVYGAPNAGKSSLINAILREERILVSAVAGTTRDAVQVRLLLSQGEVELVDTAGLSAHPQDELDAMAQRKTQQVLEQAEHAILVLDATTAALAETQAQVEDALARNQLVVWSKSDLLPAGDAFAFAGWLTSSRTMAGVDDLLAELDVRVFGTAQSEDDYWIANARQISDLKEAIAAVEKSQQALRDYPYSPEIIAFEFMGVRNALRRLIGEISSEDVLNSIFNDFCIGK